MAEGVVEDGRRGRRSACRRRRIRQSSSRPRPSRAGTEPGTRCLSGLEEGVGRTVQKRGGVLRALFSCASEEGRMGGRIGTFAGGDLAGETLRVGGLHFRGITKTGSLRRVEVALNQVWRTEQLNKIVLREQRIGGILPLRAFANTALQHRAPSFCDSSR